MGTTMRAKSPIVGDFYIYRQNGKRYKVVDTSCWYVAFSIRDLRVCYSLDPNDDDYYLLYFREQDTLF